MVNSETTLKEFVLSIPACCADCSLESWIFAMNKSELGMVALIDNEGKPQRLLQNHCLLLEIAKIRLGDRESQNIEQHFNVTYLEQITVPVIALSSQMKVQNFLARHHQEPQQNYFIVDKVGKLLGVLDFSKLLQVLATEGNLNETRIPDVFPQKNTLVEESLPKVKEFTHPYRANQTKSFISNRYLDKSELGATENKPKKVIIEGMEFKAINPTFYACLLQIAAPLAIENESGEICYQNELWHRSNKAKNDLREGSIWQDGVASPEFAKIQENLQYISEKEKPISALTSPSIELSYEPKQLNRKKHTLDTQAMSFDSNHCATGNNNLAVVTSASNRVKKQVKQLNSFLAKAVSEEKSSATNPVGEKIEEEAISWHYYRLPLKVESDRVIVTESPNYWLVFATPFSLQHSVKDSEQQRQFLLKQLQNEFLLNISHDIKSPLTAIIGLSSLLKEEKLGTLNSNQVRYSQMIYHSGKRLITLINDFLEIIHLNTKKLQFDFESIELENTFQQIYHQVTEKLKAVAAIKQNKVSLFPELQLDVATNAQTVMVDKAYFCQILTRLLENALNFTSSEELLGITAEHWSTNWLAITVWNEGGGFSEAQQNILTRGFSQYATFLASQEKDRELGLILAQQLAQANGGDISFISQSNYGSEFTLLLPLQPHRQQLENDSLSHEIYSQPNRNSLVLIIETASKRIIDLSEKLKSLGYHCAIARDSSEALYKARCLQPCKIILNSSFLETSEPNLVKFLKNDPITRKIPLLITTNNSFLDDSWANLVEGAIGFPATKANLAQFFTPIVPRQSVLMQNLTVLRLSLREEIGQIKENLALDFVFENPSFSICHHIIEADSLEQAKLLVDIWDIDVIIWDGATLKSPETYLQSFARSDVLASIPIITLDARTTAAANKIFNLAVFPCLLPANQRSIQQLTQVIQIAAGFG